MIRLHLHPRRNTHTSILRTQWIPRCALNLSTGQVDTQTDQRPRNQKDDNNRRQNTEAVPRDDTALLAVVAGIEEAVGVEALGVVSDVCDRQVTDQEEDEDGDGYPGVGACGWEDDF